MSELRSRAVGYMGSKVTLINTFLASSQLNAHFSTVRKRPMDLLPGFAETGKFFPLAKYIWQGIISCDPKFRLESPLFSGNTVA